MRGHPALFAALATATLIAARLLAISRFDVNTAAMILQVSGTGTALAGTALTLLPPLVTATTLFLAVVVFIDPTLLDTPLPREWLLALAIAASICLTAFPLASATLALVGVISAAGWALRRRHLQVSIQQELRDSRLLRIELAILFVLIAMAPLVLQRPWLPLQELGLEDHSVIVGYVLGEAEGQIVVMADQDRSITLLDPDMVEKREICQGEAQPGGALSGVPQIRLSGSALGFLLWGHRTPRYPDCADTHGAGR